MARLLLRRVLGVGLVGALAFAGAASPARAATGDRWVWPGPPESWRVESMFFDSNRHAMSFTADDGALWTFSSDAPRGWVQRAAVRWPFHSEDPLAWDAAGDRLLVLDDRYVPDDTCCAAVFLTYAAGYAMDGSGIASLGGNAPPHFREKCAAAVDTRRHRLLVWGGWDRSSREVVASTHVDVLDLGASGGWSGFDLASPPTLRGESAAVYDSVGDRLIAFGGRDSVSIFRRDLYTLDLASPTAWVRQAGPDSITTPSTGSMRALLALDAPRGRLLYVTAVNNPTDGGIPIDGPTPDSIVVWQHALSPGAGWSVVPYAGRSPDVDGALAAFDPERDRLSLFGGGQRSDFEELALDGASAWVTVQKSDWIPWLEGGAVTMLDARHDRVIAFDDRLDRPWILHRGAMDDWERGWPRTESPGGRPNACAAYDTTTGTGYLFGGGNDDGELGDLWRFTIDDSDRVAWQRQFLEGETPEPRWGASSVFDPVRRRMIVFGGYAGRPLGDTWELSFGPPLRWRRLPVRGTPPSARYWSSAVYDSRRDAMLLFGGNTGTRWSWQLEDDTWELSFADGDAWVPVSAVGRPPTPRCGQGAVYDSRRDRMLVFWGAAYNGGRIDCLELDLADGPTWRPFAPTGLDLVSRSFFHPVYDPLRDQALLLGGEYASGGNGPSVFPLNLYADFSGNPEQSPPPLVGPPLALLGFAPNPTPGEIGVAFDIPQDATVHARVYSAAGRLVWDLGDRHYVAGRHLLVLDGKDVTGARAASGVYFARMSVLGRDFSGKFILFH